MKHLILFFFLMGMSYITVCQNVGIGTTAPAEKLHISNGQLRLSRTASFNNNIIFNMPLASGVASESQGLQFQLNNENKAYIGYTNSPISGNMLRFSHSSPGASDLVISSAGNVGIGTSSPAEKFHVSGNLLMNATNPIFSLQNDGTDKGYIQLSGNDVRLGTFASNDLGKLILRVNGLNTLTVTPDGNVGIGNETPSGKLHVAGRTYLNNGSGEGLAIDGTNPFMQFYSSGTARFFMQLNGTHLTLSHVTGNTTGRLILNGNQVTIGQITPAAGYKLSIDGKAICEELKVQLKGNWPDYVFKNDYQLRSISELKSFIEKNNHLPGIPAAAEIEKNGIELGNMQKRMMEKIEELTLYIIQLEEKINHMQKLQKNIQ